MNACIGNDFAGDMARSHARFSFNEEYDTLVEEAVRVVVRAYNHTRMMRMSADVTCATRTPEADANPGGAGKFRHLANSRSTIYTENDRATCVYLALSTVE